MARIFITGSSDGLGQLAAKSLIAQGHRVVLHARNETRASQTQQSCPGAEGILTADLSSISQTKLLAEEANKKYGTFDAVIHNAGLGLQEPDRKTKDGISPVFAVNSLAPYILTVLMNKPKSLVYVSSGLHSGGDGSLKDLTWTSGRKWESFQAYSDSKLHNIILALAVARHWSNVSSNAIEPGWVATKLGGAGAPDDFQMGVDTQVWLATGEGLNETGKLFKYKEAKQPHKAASDVKKQEEFLSICEQVSGVKFPRTE